MAPFSWSRKQGKPIIYHDAAEGVHRIEAFFDLQDVPTAPTGRRPQLSVEPGPRTSSLINHSRSSTLTSTLSIYETSTSETSTGRASRPTSQQIEGDQVPNWNDKKGRGLLAKGSRLLKRQGSKFSLLSTQSTQSSEPPTTEDVYAPLPSPERASRQDRKESAAAVRRDVLKRQISEPFDFQHVTHTNRGHFGDLDRTQRNELISEFSAIRAGQQAKKEIRGIKVDSLPVKYVAEEELETPLGSPTLILPVTTPPRPAPPPKDTPSFSTSIDVRKSRSVENFSRPAPRSPVSPATPRQLLSISEPASPASLANSTDARGDSGCSTLHPESDGVMSLASAPTKAAEMLDKPLPPGPLVVHAVSTADNTARPLRIGPLPKIPGDLSDVPEEDEANHDGSSLTKPGSKRQSLRHVQTFPSANSPVDHRKSSLAAKDSVRSKRSKPDGQSPANVSKAVTSPPRKRISIGLKAIAIQDWEDAVDSSWDFDPDAEDTVDWPAEVDVNVNNLPIHLDGSCTSEGDQSCPSPTITPIPWKTPARRELDPSPTDSETIVALDASTLVTTVSRPTSSGGVLPPSDSLALHGLGIEPASTSNGLGEESSSPSRDDTPRPDHSPASRDRISSHSNISKSSSQESIILSIASSLFSAHRSSNSTASLPDLTPSTASVKERSFTSQPQTPKEEYCDCMGAHGDLSKMDCLGHCPAPLVHVPSCDKFDVRLLQFSDSNFVSHRRAKSLTPDFAVSDNSTAPMKSELSIPTTISSGITTSSDAEPSDSRKDSASRITVPARTSSIAPLPDIKKTPTGRRQRSATTSSAGSRPTHKSRASYSLFPGGSLAPA